MRIIFLIFTILILTGCINRNYTNVEDRAIQDITNDYLKIKHLSKNRLKRPPAPTEDNIKVEFGIKMEKQDVYKVFISDALLPISQVKEDNQWMFNKMYKSPSLDSLFKSLMLTSEFDGLKYREFDKEQIKLKQPYQQFTDRKNEIGTDEEYLIFSFSRISFSADYKYGLVVLNYSFGWTNGTGGGFHRPYLIENVNNEWKVIEEN